ncbi:MAG: NHL repeat-containing protein [Acidobacteria bacterium]|nr:NHL repeat-containing protein [Acidobacteriota bacterium]
MTEQDCSQVVTHYGGNKLGDLYDVATGPNSEVVIVDDGNRCVVVLDDKLNLLKVIGQGSDNSRLVRPDGVAVTDNVIAVSDWGSHQVKKYSLQGELISVIGCHGNNNGQFNYPRGLAFNNNKLLYVVDGGNYRVQVFQQNDTFAFSFGNRGSNPGQFQYPFRIAIDPNNNVLVTDLHANCIHIFSDSGEFIQTINSDRPYAITISPTGYLITGHDGDDNKIRVWSPTYHLINQFGKRGSKQGEFDAINGMSIDSSGTVYVAEGSKRLQVISNN